jgi:hypothetical protein
VLVYWQILIEFSTETSYTIQQTYCNKTGRFSSTIVQPTPRHDLELASYIYSSHNPSLLSSQPFLCLRSEFFNLFPHQNSVYIHIPHHRIIDFTDLILLRDPYKSIKLALLTNIHCKLLYVTNFYKCLTIN